MSWRDRNGSPYDDEGQFAWVGLLAIALSAALVGFIIYALVRWVPW